MNTKVSPVIVGIAVVLLVVICIGLYIHANDSASPNQLPPPTDTFKPGYNIGGDRNAGPHNDVHRQAASGTAPGAPKP